MVNIKHLLVIGIVTMFSSCVTTKQFNDTQSKLTDCNEENRLLQQANMNLSTKKTELESELGRLKLSNAELLKQNKDLAFAEENYSRKLKNIENEKAVLEEQLSRLSSGSSEEITNLLKELQVTREGLTTREDRLRAAEKELEARNSRLTELENILHQKDMAVKELKSKVAAALVGFNNNGLSVYEKNGKVYVSLEERLLFQTGKWDVDPNGQKALKELATVLAQNPDINIMVEGHTDNVPMNGSGAVKDNWDLSVMRSTAVTKILTQNIEVDPKRIISAGRSEFFPLDVEETKEARQKNRRTEIILTPKLDELLKLLEMN